MRLGFAILAPVTLDGIEWELVEMVGEEDVVSTLNRLRKRDGYGGDELFLAEVIAPENDPRFVAQMVAKALEGVEDEDED